MSSVKQFLFTIRNEQSELKELQERIEELSVSLLPSGIRYDKDKIQVSPSDVTSDKMAKLADYENMLTQKSHSLIIRKLQAQKIINALPDSRERQVLDMYFLARRKWRMREIADFMGYSHTQTVRFYEKGLKHAEMVKNGKRECGKIVE